MILWDSAPKPQRRSYDAPIVGFVISALIFAVVIALAVWGTVYWEGLPR